MWMLYGDRLFNLAIYITILIGVLVSIIYVLVVKKRNMLSNLLIVFFVMFEIFMFANILKVVILDEKFLVFYKILELISIFLMMVLFFMVTIFLIVNQIKRFKYYVGLTDFPAVIKTIEDPIIIFDYKGQVLDIVDPTKTLKTIIGNYKSSSVSIIVNNISKLICEEKRDNLTKWASQMTHHHQFELCINKRFYLFTSSPIVTKFKGFLGCAVVFHDIQSEKELNQLYEEQNSQLLDVNLKLQRYIETMEMLETEHIKLKLIKQVQTELTKGTSDAITSLEKVINDNESYDEEDYNEIAMISQQLREVLEKIRQTAKKMALH